MKKLLILGAICSLLFASCSQEDEQALSQPEQAVQSKATIVNPDNTITLYLYKTATGTWKYTTDLTVVGSSQYDVYGRVYATQQPGTVLVYSTYNSRTGDVTLSIDKDEITNSYNGEWKMGETLGYAYDPYDSNTNQALKTISRPPLYMDWDNEMVRFDDFARVSILAPYTINTQTVYYYKTSTNEWKYTTNLAEVGTNQYQITGRVYQTKQANTVPVYQCYNPQYGYALVADLSELSHLYGDTAWTVGNVIGYGYSRTLASNLLPKNTTPIVRVPLWVDLNDEMSRFEQPETMLYLIKN